MIKSTLGGKGKNVIIYQNDEVRFTKDGVSVARALADKKDSNVYNKIGSKIVVNAANKTVEKVGDGTTLTSIMLQAIINNCNYDDINGYFLTLSKDLTNVQKYLKGVCKDVKDISTIRKIARTSSNSERIGDKTN